MKFDKSSVAVHVRKRIIVIKKMAKKKTVLFATGNSHKKERFQFYFESLGLEIVDFNDLGVSPKIEENGKTPEENALMKAKAGFNVSGLPSFGVDYWFYINGLSEEKQPGAFVRRISSGKGGKRTEATDAQMLKYYSKLIGGLGGKTKGGWLSAIALVVGEGKKYIEKFEGESVLTSKISPLRTKGEPLNSLQIDPKTGKYFTELTKREWLELQKKREKSYVDFMRQHLKEIMGD